MEKFRALDLAIGFSKKACQLELKGHLKDQRRYANVRRFLNL